MIHQGGVVQWESTSFARRKPWVQIPASPSGEAATSSVECQEPTATPLLTSCLSPPSSQRSQLMPPILDWDLGLLTIGALYPSAPLRVHSSVVERSAHNPVGRGDDPSLKGHDALPNGVRNRVDQGSNPCGPTLRARSSVRTEHEASNLNGGGSNPSALVLL